MANGINILIPIIAVVIALVIAVPVACKLAVAKKVKQDAEKIGTAEEKARNIIDEALKTAETKKREALLEAKEESLKTKNELEKETRERRSELQKYEKRVLAKEESVDRKANAMERREAEGPKHFDMNLTRAKFDELTHDLVEMTAEPVRRALSDAGITASELGQVLLVGGSSRIPAVQDKVRQLTGKEPSKNLNPDECVALGASIQGGKLAGDAGAGDILLLDVTPLSLSIETMGGIATRLIERNTTIPTRKSQIFSTAADNQTAVDINVVQGERQFAKDNKSLGQFRLDGIPPARRGVPQIEVTFDIDANGIVNVSAKDLGTGKEQHITITAGSNMSDDDIDKAVKEAAEFEAQDKKRKEAIDTRNNADSMVFQVENALKEAGDKIDANDKAAVEADLNALKDLLSQTANAEEMTDSQVADIKAAQEKMMESAQKLFAKMYEQTQQAGGQAGPDMNMGGGAAGSTDAGNNDDVVDADYKEV